MSRKHRITERLKNGLAPTHLRIDDETGQHSVPSDAESHFKVVVVSPQFSGQPLVARHRLINRAVEGELASGLHALAIHAYTPEEWEARGAGVPPSPPCRGGSKATRQGPQAATPFAEQNTPS